MPPSAIKTIKDLVFWQYANIIAEGKYLKYLFSLHQKPGTPGNRNVIEMCNKCDMKEHCIKENSVEKLSVYCLEGCFLK